MVSGFARHFRWAVPAFVALIATSSPTHAQSINLSWDDCGAAGTEIEAFACDTNTGPSFDLVGSFVAPPDITQFLGISAELRVAATVLPDWWKLGSGQCRSPTVLNASFDPSPSCADLFDGNGVGGVSYQVGGFGANTARISVQAALQLGLEHPIQSGQEYSAFRLTILPARTIGASSCSGCLEPVRLTLNNIQVFQPDAVNSNPVLTTPAVRNIAYWQGATGTLPSISSFTPPGGPEGAGVIISGTGLTATSKVRFADVSTSPTFSSATEVQATVPAGARTGTLQVDTPFGTATSNGSFVVAPTIVSFIPTQAPPGAAVRLYGRNFTGATSVSFGAEPSAFAIVSDGEIETTVPAGSPGGTITVTNPGGSGSRSGFTVGSAEGGFNLSWTDCGVAGSELQTFACNSNIGSGFTLVGSFVPPPGITQLTGVAADLRISSTVLPDWWKFGPGQCRASASLTASLDFAGMTGCADPWGGPLGMFWTYTLGSYGPESARLRVYADPFGTGVAVEPDREYYGFKIRIPQNKTVGTAVCTGCNVPTTIAVQTFELHQGTASTTLSLPAHRATVQWQGVPGPLPVVAGFTPPGGPVGTQVTITGTAFLGADQVRFGTVPATFAVVSDGEISTSVPAGARSAPIVVHSPSGNGVSATLFHIPPVFDQIIPPIALVGASVGLIGSNLSGVTSVTFSGTPAAFTIASDELITAVVPEGAATGPVVVSSPGGAAERDFTVSATPAGGINLAWDDCGSHGFGVKSFACDANGGTPFPLVVSFEPPPGIVAATGIVSRIRLDATTLPDWWRHGAGQCRGDAAMTASLASVTSCANPWNGQASANILHSIDHYGPNTARITVFSNPASGSIELFPEEEYLAVQLLIQKNRVIGAGSCSGCENHVRLTLEEIEITQSNGIPYNPVLTIPRTRSSVLWQGAPGPLPVISSLVPAGAAIGAPATLRGTGLASTITVSFNGTTASFSDAADTVVAAMVPAGATAGPVTVRTRNGSGSSSSPFFIAPTVLSLFPLQAPVGTTITLSGTNFTGMTAVTFNGIAATFVVVDDTRVRAVVPEGATSGPVAVTNPGGTDFSESPFLIGPVIDGVNLSWDDCGSFGAEIQTFACNSNVGSPFSLVGSFRAAGIENLQGINAELSVNTGGGPLPDWWKFGPGFCRTAGDLTTSLDFTTTTCQPPWSGTAGVSHLFDAGFSGPSSARLRIFMTAPAGAAGPLDAGLEFYAFRVDVKRSMTPPGGCSSCSVPLRIELTSIQLVQSTAEGFDPVLDAPLDRNVVYWQRVPAPVPVIASFAPPGGEPGTEVTLRGSSFSAVTEVRFHNSSTSYSVISDSVIVSVVPPDARSGPLHVSSADGTGSSAVLFQAAPVLIRFLPGQAPEGATVALLGINLTGTTQVLFNGQPATFTVESDTLVRAVVPVGASRGPVTISNLGGTDVSDVHFVVGPVARGEWTVVDPPFNGPGHEFETMVHDPVGRRMIVIGERSTWSLSLTGPMVWTLLAFQSFTVRAPSAVFDPDSNRIVAFGGNEFVLDEHPWILDLSSSSPAWVRRITPSPRPQGRLLPATIHDPVRNRMIIHGGYTGSGVIQSDTWALSLHDLTWVQLTPPSTPPRWAHAAIYDPLGDRMVIYGGRTDPGNSVVGDVAALSLANPVSWTPIHPVGPAPSIRAHVTCVYDPVTSGMMLHGGWGPTTPGRLNDTWLLDLANDPVVWRQIETFGSLPPPLSHQAGAVDPDSSRLVTIGGFPLADNDRAWRMSLGPPEPAVAITAFSPAGGPTGTPVTLTGMGFSTVIAVRFGSVPAPFTIVGDTEIRTSIPAGARPGPIFAVAPLRTVRSLLDFFPTPRIASFAPMQAPVGNIVRIVGVNFTGTTQVRFGTIETTYETVLDTLIQAVVPEGFTQERIIVTNPGGADTTGGEFTVGPVFVTEGINLSWDDCGDHGVSSKAFACDAGSGPPFTLVVSFAPPPGIQAYAGISAVLTLGNSLQALPDWWRHGTGACRGSAALASDFDFTAGPFSCQDAFGGLATGGFAYQIGNPTPSKVRLTVQAAVPAGSERALDPGAEYYGVKLNISRSKASGADACSGCSTPVCIQLNEVQVFQPAPYASNPKITVPMSNNIATWQGATSCVLATPVQVSVVTAEVKAGEVHLAWELPRGEGATLYRREAEGEWRRITTLAPNGERRLEYVDRDVKGGTTYGYHLGISIGDEEIIAGEISVTVPVRVLKLALNQVYWSGRSLKATVALPGAEGARFEVFDPGGRRAFSSALDHLGAGEHQIRFTPALRPGVYFARVSHNGAKAGSRFVVLQ